jgi:hypothetical protein
MLALDDWLTAYGRLVCAKLSSLDALENPVCLLLGVVGAVRNCQVFADEFRTPRPGRRCPELAVLELSLRAMLW